jgi:hypothetical protein
VRLLRDDDTGAEIEATAHPGVGGSLRALRLALAPDLVRPTRVLLVEGPRDKTLIEFGALAVDAPVDERRMRPPP